MWAIFKQHQKQIRIISLITILAVPFLLYGAASHDLSALVNLLLGVMGLGLLLTLLSG